MKDADPSILTEDLSNHLMMQHPLQFRDFMKYKPPKNEILSTGKQGTNTNMKTENEATKAGILFIIIKLISSFN